MAAVMSLRMTMRVSHWGKLHEVLANCSQASTLLSNPRPPTHRVFERVLQVRSKFEDLLRALSKLEQAIALRAVQQLLLRLPILPYHIQLSRCA